MIVLKLTSDEVRFLMMLRLNPDELRAFTGPLPDGRPASDEGALGAIHKARYLEFKRMVEESETWLKAHDMDIPKSFEDMFERAMLASAKFTGDN